jgi:uncharacterized protein DUF4326
MPDRVKVEGDLFHGLVPENAIYAGRPAPGLPGSKFANPFGLKRRFGRNHPLRPYLDAAVREVLGIGSDSRGGHWDIITPGVPSVAVAAYRLWLRDQPDLIRAAREELAGRDLACWCGPDDPCHCDVLLEISNDEGNDHA